MIPGINNWAHGGGIASGILVGFLMGYREKRPENFLHRVIATGCIVLTIGILLWAVLQALYHSFA
jgi:rhomboid protease GluP